MLIEMLLESARRSPQTVAVADSMRSFTYKQLTRIAMVMRQVIRSRTNNDHVGIMLPSSSLFPAVLMGTLWASRTAVPLNFLLSAEELLPVVQDAGLDTIITVKHFSKLLETLPVKVVYLEDLPLKRKIIFSYFKPIPPAPKVELSDTAVLLYTSGTTGQPKGVELTYDNLYSNCTDTITSLEIDQHQIFLNILPPFHVFGLTANVLVPIMLGASVFAIPRFSPVAVIKSVAENGVTLMMAIPSMYAAILKSKSATADSFRSIKLAISGGEPLSDRVRARFEERYNVILKQGYGLTETSPVISVSSAKHFRDGTVGRLIRNVEVRIVDENDRDLPAGEEGEIYVRSPGVMKGYYRKPEETAKVIDKEGWFHTGDIGRLETDRYLSITGRAKDMLIIGGENVFPREIEAALEAVEGVLQVAVIGMADDLRGEVPVAFVMPESHTQLDEQTLRSIARQSLAGFKVPRRIEIRDDLPTGPTGKILKRRLHELL